MKKAEKFKIRSDEKEAAIRRLAKLNLPVGSPRRMKCESVPAPKP